MATTIELGKLNRLFDNFLRSDLTDFADFLRPYVRVTSDGLIDFGTIAESAIPVRPEDLLAKMNAENAAKYGEYLSLLSAIKGYAFKRAEQPLVERFAKQVKNIALRKRLAKAELNFKTATLKLNLLGKSLASQPELLPLLAAL